MSRIIINNDSTKKKIIAVQGKITNQNPQNDFRMKRLLNVYSNFFFRFLFINIVKYIKNQRASRRPSNSNKLSINNQRRARTIYARLFYTSFENEKPANQVEHCKKVNFDINIKQNRHPNFTTSN